MFYDEAEAYEALVEGVSPIPIGQPSWREGEVVECELLGIVSTYVADAQVMSLDGRWLDCIAVRLGRGDPRTFWVETIGEPIKGGMSSSPFVTPEGVAFGVAVTDKGPHPNILLGAPAWFAAEFYTPDAKAPVT